MAGCWPVAVRAPRDGQRPTPALLTRTARTSGSPRVQTGLLGAALTAPVHAGACFAASPDAFARTAQRCSRADQLFKPARSLALPHNDHAEAAQ
jgi:hypothetical protein